MAREQFTEQELDKGIFRPKQDEDIQQDEVLPEIVFFTIDAKLLDEDGPKAYAKKSGTRFYVKSNGGQLADPRGLYESDLYKRVGDTPTWRWKQVNAKVFDFYLAYLKTANKSHYHNASREMF